MGVTFETRDPPTFMTSEGFALGEFPLTAHAFLFLLTLFLPCFTGYPLALRSRTRSTVPLMTSMPARRRRSSLDGSSRTMIS
jgi:hypothetical protein